MSSRRLPRITRTALAPLVVLGLAIAFPSFIHGSSPVVVRLSQVTSNNVLSHRDYPVNNTAKAVLVDVEFLLAQAPLAQRDPGWGSVQYQEFVKQLLLELCRQNGANTAVVHGTMRVGGGEGTSRRQLFIDAAVPLRFDVKDREDLLAGKREGDEVYAAVATVLRYSPFRPAAVRLTDEDVRVEGDGQNVQVVVTGAGTQLADTFENRQALLGRVGVQPSVATVVSSTPEQAVASATGKTERSVITTPTPAPVVAAVTEAPAARSTDLRRDTLLQVLFTELGRLVHDAHRLELERAAAPRDRRAALDADLETARERVRQKLAEIDDLN